MGDHEYAIDGGRHDADRLARQASVMAAGTMGFLTSLGVGPGSACVDVGCGGGQVSLDLARLVGPSGRVVGIDVDAAALDIARGGAEAAGVEVTFVRADAAAPFEPGAFDVAVARLLLSHLVEPMAVVRAMADLVRPGGVVAVEDLYTPALRADPPVAALDRLAEVYGATVRARGGDPTLGPRLRAHLAAAGLRDVTERTVVNAMTGTHEKMFLTQLLDNMRTTILETGSATAADLDDIRAGVATAAASEDVTFYQARMHQVSGRRPI